MVKTAVIGVGSMGQHHARVYSQLENSQLVGVSDTDLNIAKNVADRFDVPAYDNYIKMLEIEKPEAVTVAVPTNKHEMVVSDVLDAGAHVLVEKPIAATLEEGQRLIDKAKTLNRQLMVGHIVVLILRHNYSRNFRQVIWGGFTRLRAAVLAHFRGVSGMLV